MINLSVKAAKGGFFDRSKVIAAFKRAERNVLNRFGAFVRQRAKTSIRKRKTVSAPGGPPSSHVGTLRRFIKFAYDSRTSSVVIGPERLGNTVDPAALPAMEYSGRSTGISKGKRRSISVRARPFMGPAFEAEKPGLAAMWRDSVR